MDFVDTAFAQLSEWLASALPQGMVNDLIVNGVLAGLGGVIIFIPQIFLLTTSIILPIIKSFAKTKTNSLTQIVIQLRKILQTQYLKNIVS